MICLGIESSCDDTSLAIVQDGKLLGQKTSSQIDVHAIFGGVVPEIASREHGRLIGHLFDALLKEHRLTPADIDLVAVSRGPGLLGSLLVGLAFAKGICLGTGAKLIGVNHLHAHIFAAGLDEKLQLPALALLVSGGHTQICLVEAPDHITVLGSTLDDAAGEAFDKAGKMLGLPYPAGKYMDELGKDCLPDPKMFPRPYLNNDNLNFSFSGLKTSMKSRLEALETDPVNWDLHTGKIILQESQRQHIGTICSSYNMAVVDTLLEKTRRALAKTPNVKSLILAGGVAANRTLRQGFAELSKQMQLAMHIPNTNLCSDNGAMVAYLGQLLAMDGYCHDLNLSAIPRGQKIPQDMRKTFE